MLRNLTLSKIKVDRTLPSPAVPREDKRGISTYGGHPSQPTRRSSSRDVHHMSFFFPPKRSKNDIFIVFCKSKSSISGM